MAPLRMPMITMPGTGGQSALDHHNIELFSSFGDKRYAFQGDQSTLTNMYRKSKKRSFTQGRRGNARKSLFRPSDNTSPTRGEQVMRMESLLKKALAGHSDALPPMRPAVDKSAVDGAQLATPLSRRYGTTNREWFKRVGTRNPLPKFRDDEAQSPGRLSCFIGESLPTIPHTRSSMKKKPAPPQAPVQYTPATMVGEPPEAERAAPVRLPTPTQPAAGTRRVVISPVVMPVETQEPCPALALTGGRWVVTDVAPPSERSAAAVSPQSSMTPMSLPVHARITVRGPALPHLAGRPHMPPIAVAVSGGTATPRSPV